MPRLKCSICLCHLGKKKFITECNHKFHYKCILRWILNNDTCPMCRQIIRDIGDEVDIEDIERTRDIFFLVARLLNLSV